jgi:hypothetical protein
MLTTPAACRSVGRVAAALHGRSRHEATMYNVMSFASSSDPVQQRFGWKIGQGGCAEVRV